MQYWFSWTVHVSGADVRCGCARLSGGGESYNVNFTLYARVFLKESAAVEQRECVGTSRLLAAQIW